MLSLVKGKESKMIFGHGFVLGHIKSTEKEKGKNILNITYRPFPVVRHASHSTRWMIAECLKEKGKVWDYRSISFDII